VLIDQILPHANGYGPELFYHAKGCLFQNRLFKLLSSFFLMLVKITVLHQYYSNTSDFVEVRVLSLLFANVMSPGYAIYWVHWTWQSPKHLLFGIIA